MQNRCSKSRKNERQPYNIKRTNSQSMHKVHDLFIHLKYELGPNVITGNTIILSTKTNPHTHTRARARAISNFKVKPCALFSNSTGAKKLKWTIFIHALKTPVSKYFDVFQKKIAGDSAIRKIGP